MTFVKTGLCDVIGLRQEAAVKIGILNNRYGSNDRSNLDGIDWSNTIKKWSGPKMTHFTFAIKTRQPSMLSCERTTLS